jgi:NADPH:quinone reductase-like Zn-dependent oxidoreductase
MLEGLQSLRPGGRLVAYGMSGAVTGQRRNLLAVVTTSLSFLRINLLKLVQNNWGVFGLDVLRLWEEEEVLRGVLERLVDGVQDGSYRPVIDTTFPLEEAGAAHRYLHERKNIGKVVLTTGQ